ncbi:MAG: alpha-galactosidase [Chloroflexi bacterium]|nr:alpha-galactosidase [Chloroflexota bacterium]
MTLSLPSQPLRYYRHGWQSWSLAAWVDANRRIQPPKPPILHPMQIDPLYARETRPHGSWVGAVELDNGNIFLLGALGLDAHVTLDGSALIGRYESGQGDWFVGEGAEQEIFARYTDLLGKRLGEKQQAKTPRVWCSWYSLYTQISEERLLRILDGLGDLPFDVFQVDDGWQRAIGDWEPNEKFPSGMDELAAQIRRSGRTPGLWLAPLIMTPSSRLYRQHPDWLLHDENGKPVSAGFNWGEPLYALDTTHPDVLNWLRALMQKVRVWGYDYVKLDFLYAGALPGKRHIDMPREQAYRHGLTIIREALGDAYFLTCGAPILPSIGLCDAIRVGPDVAAHWDSARDSVLLGNLAIPSTRNAIRTTVNRLWLSPLVHTDPDVVYFRSRHLALTEPQKRQLQDLALICGYKATSDVPAWLSGSERAALRAFLETEPVIERTGRYTFTLDGRQADFSAAAALPAPPTPGQRLASTALGWAVNSRYALQLNGWLGKMTVKRKLGDSK